MSCDGVVLPRAIFFSFFVSKVDTYGFFIADPNFPGPVYHDMPSLVLCACFWC